MADRIETRLISHHVGARGFGVAMATPRNFDDDIVHITYEADAACAAEMQRDRSRTNFHVLPIALGRSDGEATLHITTNPYGSSLYRPNPRYAAWYGEVYPNPSGVYDAIFDSWCRVEREVPIRTAALDSLFARGEVPLSAGPDFLSLDTQGSEADIIDGAARSIAANVLAIATEIEFHQIYESQPLFSQILDRLLPMGFHFAGFQHIADELSPRRAPLGQRGRGFLAFGDALFLRRIEDLPAMAGGNQAKLCTLAFKAAFVGVVFGYIEYALDALDLAVELSADHAPPELQDRVYYRMLLQLDAARRQMEPVFLPTEPRGGPASGSTPQDPAPAGRVAEAWRFARGTVINGVRRVYDRLALYVDGLPHRRIRHLIWSRPHEAVLRAALYLMQLIHAKTIVARKTSPGYRGLTLFEDALVSYNLHWVAMTVRRRRLRALRALAETIP